MTTPQYDLAIIGTGPAGFTASIYASRYAVKHVIIGTIIGGQSSEAHLIQNYPPFQSIKGPDLMMKFKEHAESYHPPILYDKVTKISGNFMQFILKTEAGKTIHAKTILLAIGMQKRKLGIPGEQELLGKGVTYCATCDGMLYKGKTVGVVGGSDAANTASLFLADITQKVYQIYRGNALRGEVFWTKKVQADKRIEVIYGTNITKINGSNRIDSVTLDTEYKGSSVLKLDGLFIEIGCCEPDPAIVKPLGLHTEEEGFIRVDQGHNTSIRGIWAAGDSTSASNHFHQIITASAEGAVAVENIFRTLKKGP